MRFLLLWVIPVAFQWGVSAQHQDHEARRPMEQEPNGDLNEVANHTCNRDKTFNTTILIEHDGIDMKEDPDNIELFALAQGVLDTYNNLNEPNNATARCDDLYRKVVTSVEARAMGSFERVEGDKIDYRRIILYHIQGVCSGDECNPDSTLAFHHKKVKGKQPRTLTLEDRFAIYELPGDIDDAYATCHCPTTSWFRAPTEEEFFAEFDKTVKEISILEVKAALDVAAKAEDKAEKARKKAGKAAKHHKEESEKALKKAAKDAKKAEKMTEKIKELDKKIADTVAKGVKGKKGEKKIESLEEKKKDAKNVEKEKKKESKEAKKYAEDPEKYAMEAAKKAEEEAKRAMERAEEAAKKAAELAMEDRVEGHNITAVVEIQEVKCDHDMTASHFESYVTVEYANLEETNEDTLGRLSQAFFDSYNGLAILFCDPARRKLTSIEVVEIDEHDEYEEDEHRSLVTRRRSKGVKYLLNLRCWQAKNEICNSRSQVFDDTNAILKMRRLPEDASQMLRRTKRGKQCFCALEPHFERGPFEHEFAGWLNQSDALVADQIDVLSVTEVIKEEINL